ncbi:MAG: ABC transporter permease [Planctomycetota bacterium]|jgi:putative ABC transport system permease protein
MKRPDLLRISVGNLGRRKVRSALTLIGVVIGVGALVLMVSLGIGIKVELLEVLDTEDFMRTMFVSKKGEGGGGRGLGMFGMGGFSSEPMTDEDLAQIRDVRHVSSVTPELMLFVTVRYEELRLKRVQVLPLLPTEEAELRDALTHGRLWAAADAKECVIPSEFFRRNEEYTPEEVLGKQVTMGTKAGGEYPYTVVGVFDSEKLGIAGSSVFLPLDAAKTLREKTKGGLYRMIYQEGVYIRAVVRVKDPRHAGGTEDAIEDLGFRALTAEDIISGINTLFLVIEGFFLCVGAVGVIVALFGIANTMAMSVLERTREIGIMKALGARKRDILKLFLLEAVWLGILGGSIGLFGGWVLGIILNIIARGAYDVPERVSLFHVSPLLALGSVLFAVVVSLVAGVLPALRASRLDPVRALRYEG